MFVLNKNGMMDIVQKHSNFINARCFVMLHSVSVNCSQPNAQYNAGLAPLQKSHLIVMSIKTVIVT
jgi:hypothetical protein